MGSRAHVALVEDDPEMALALRGVLERRGYEVTLFDNGGEALAALREQRAPDLIVLDLWTPNMNGWEFRLHQRRDAKLAHIPLIAISADRSPHAAAIDADRFLAKPVTGSALLDTVEELLAERRTRPQLDFSALTDETWNALFMILTDLRDGRVHVRTLASDLQGFPAARTVALEVLLERAEACAQKALESQDRQRDAHAVAFTERHPALQFDDLSAFLEALAPPSARAVWQERALPAYVPHAVRTARADLLGVLARCLREAPDLPPGLRFELRADALGPVRAEPELLARLLHNLLRNAFEALAEAPRPELFVYALDRGEFIELAISDSGRGVRVRELERAFDPFFSTKHGHTGLGLTVARRLAASMDGRVELDREPGGGTVSRLLLRSVERTPAPSAQAVVERPRVLLIHEQERARGLKAVLDAHFQVVVLDPETALRHLLSEATYDLVLCALVLPGMTGISFVSALAMTNTSHSQRVVMLVPPKFGPETPKLLDQLHLWHVDEGVPEAELCAQLRGLLRLWRELRLR